MSKTMTVQDYLGLSKANRERFARWLEDAMGTPFVEALVTEATLGDGVVTCTHLARNEDGKPYPVDGAAATTTRTYPVTTPPPVWPS